MIWRRASRAVLIVSDEAAAQSVLDSAFLRQPEIRLLTSFPDEDGLDLARRERPSLIIDDLSEANGEGLDFCRRLRDDPATKAIPLIVIAAPESCKEAKDASADALLHKPLVRHEFYKAVCRFIPLPTRGNRRLKTNLRFAYVAEDCCGQAFSRDLSVAGAFLKTDRLLALGTDVELHFRLPGSWDEIVCRGVVRNTTHSASGSSQRSGMGIEFVGMSDEQIDQLENFIGRNLRRPFLSRC